MKKTSYELNITEENADQFVLIDKEEMQRTIEYVSIIQQQLRYLNNQLEALGFTSWGDCKAKTLADINVKKARG